MKGALKAVQKVNAKNKKERNDYFFLLPIPRHKKSFLRLKRPILKLLKTFKFQDLKKTISIIKQHFHHLKFSFNF